MVRIVNETSIILKCVEDHSGNWYRGLHKHFGVISHQHPHFPEWLGPLYFENTSLVGYPFEILRRPRDILSNQISSQVIKSGMLEKKVIFSYCLIFISARVLYKIGNRGGLYYDLEALYTVRSQTRYGGYNIS